MCFYCDREVKGNPQLWWYTNFVCWTCRIQNGVKKQFTGTIDNGRKCYRCHQDMTDVGFKFRVPKKQDVHKWKHLQNTWENQYTIQNGVKCYVGPKKRTIIQTF